jgi:hypothetical protein
MVVFSIKLLSGKGDFKVEIWKGCGLVRQILTICIHKLESEPLKILWNKW